MHKVLTGLLAVPNDIETRILLRLDPEQRASAFAWRNASPSAIHLGQSLLVSANQPGLGKLPAIAASNMVFLWLSALSREKARF